MLSFFSNLLLFLGRHVYLILIGCAEVVLAVILLGVLPRRRRPPQMAVSGGSEAQQTLLQSLAAQKDTLYLLLRRADLLPVFCAGDLPAALGVTLERMQEDLSVLFSSLRNPEDGSQFWKAYQNWDGGTALSAQLETKSGEWFHVCAERCENHHYDLFTFQNITVQRQQEEHFEQRLQQAEQASQFKTSFLFRMSHEIRTPMNGITGMLTLAEGKLTPEHPAMQYLTRADELTDHLLSLINDILDMSRIEAGKVELESAPFSLRALGAKLYDMFAKSLDARGIHYAVNFEEVTADWVVGDELRISQVIINFLSNAVKFTSEGEIIVTFRQMMLQEGCVDFMIRVHDTGIGMKSEFISRIFRPFEQEDASTTRRFGGTGLGMAISDQLVKLMGGQIVVESLPGVGSDFSVYLSLPTTEAPAAQEESAAETEHAPAPAPASLDCRVLIAEDNEINAMITQELLKEKGAQVDIAENGQLAVEAFTAHPADYYDLILMDIQMPVMDGHAAARAIRKLPRPDAAAIPIYALSADAFVEDERLSRESGMNGHLTKPIDFDLLCRIIQKILSKKEHTEA